MKRNGRIFKNRISKCYVPLRDECCCSASITWSTIGTQRLHFRRNCREHRERQNAAGISDQSLEGWHLKFYWQWLVLFSSFVELVTFRCSCVDAGSRQIETREAADRRGAEEPGRSDAILLSKTAQVSSPLCKTSWHCGRCFDSRRRRNY